MFGTLGRLRRADRRGAPARPQGDDRPGALAHLRPASAGSRESRVEPRQPQGRLVRLGRRQARRHAAQQLAVDLRRLGLGVGPARGCSTTCTISSPSSRTSTSTIRRCRTRCSTSTRFWLERGVDGFRLDTINFYFHDAGAARTIRRCRRSERNDSTAPAVNPYNCQDHLYDKSRPENLAFLKRFRAVARRVSGDIAAVGEVGDAQRGLEIVGDYTAGDDRMHMCYAFEFLGARKADGRQGRARCCETFGTVAPRRLGVLGASPTTTSCATPRAGARRAGPRRLSQGALGAADVAARLGLPLPGRGARA